MLELSRSGIKGGCYEKGMQLYYVSIFVGNTTGMKGVKIIYYPGL
jgi:hypothetical protein